MKLVVLESRPLVSAPGAAAPVDAGGASGRVSSAAVFPRAFTTPSRTAALPALARAKAAYLAHERRVPVQLELT